MRENELRRQREKEEERLYALQTQEMTRMRLLNKFLTAKCYFFSRGMLEDDFLDKKSKMRWDLRENNLALVSIYIILLYRLNFMKFRQKTKKTKKSFCKTKKWTMRKLTSIE